MAGPSPPHRPNLNIYASYTMPGSVVDLPAVETQTQSTLPEATHKDSDLDESCIYEEELSEVQLRELYDDEEIDRFLHLFAAVSSLLPKT